MKRVLLIILTLFSLSAVAQQYNNEWIDYNKTYYKFKLSITGLYRIPQSALSSLGLAGTPVAQFQVWKNGRQVPIYTSVQTGTLGASDYIEFWGERNDGSVDNAMYRQPEFQLNSKYSLQTDSSSYFLTVNPAGGNLRLTPVANTIPTGATPDPYFMHTVGTYFGNRIFSGFASQVEHEYTYSSSYDEGEGWASGDIPKDGIEATAFSGLFPYTSAGAPNINLRVNAVGNATNPRMFSGTLNGSFAFSQQMDYFDYARVSNNFPVSTISSGNANIIITNNCVITTQPDRMAVATIELTYPRQFNFGGNNEFVFKLASNTAGNYLEISNFSYTGTPVLYDMTNGLRYDANLSTPGLLRFFLQPSSVERNLILVSNSTTTRSITSFQQRNFVNYALAANQGNYLIITNPLLSTASGGVNPITEYKNYRSSAAGGSYQVGVYMVDQLVDQFAFGIKKHPLSIRNFLRWARANYSQPLKQVFLLGHGISYPSYRYAESYSDVEQLNLVPTFGYPASDNLLAATPASGYVPLTSIGRLSVVNGDEIITYLNKVKQYELLYPFSSPSVADKSWFKNVVHVVGASDQATITLLHNALNNHKLIIEDSMYAGSVTTFVKNSADAVQQLNSAKLSNLFAEGIGLLTYFGHSSASTLEFNLDNPNAYSNQGKYPIFNVMGCNAGNFFNYNPVRFSALETLSERYVLTPQRGSIAFLASTHLGIVHYLDIYNAQQYKAISVSKYGQTIGEIKNKSIEMVAAVTSPNDFYARFQSEQYTLHGDPAIKLYSTEKPDYAIEPAMVKVNPSFISVAETGFDFNATYVNLGKSLDRPIVIEVKRTYPNNPIPEVIRRDTVHFTHFKDSIHFRIPIVPDRDKGLNKITVTLDATNAVDELYESNNVVTKEVFIYEDEARPVYPYNFSIVKQPNVKFSVSSANPFATMRQYMVEMDTTELFNSPIKVSRNISSAGGVFEFDPLLSFTNNRVYYWRVAPVVVVAGDVPKWNTFSFIYIQGTEDGFNQSHVYQQFKSTYERMRLDSASRKLIYGGIDRNIFIRSGVFPTSFSQAAGFSVVIDDVDNIRSVCGISNIVINVLDSTNLAPWFNGHTGAAGQYNSDAICGDDRSWNFQYSIINATKRRSAVDFLNMIPDGSYVIIRNCSGTDPNGNTYANDWKNEEFPVGSGNTLYHVMKAQGFNDVDSFNRPRAWVFMYQKNRGNTFTPRWVFSEGVNDPITLNVDLQTSDTLGFITSPAFGPAKGWKNLIWQGTHSDPVFSDHPFVSVIGVDYSGHETTLIENLTTSQQNYDVSSINAANYPFLKLKMANKDTAYLTPYQLSFWRLTYDPVPEGAIAPNLYYTGKDTVDVGEPVSYGFAFKNVSPTPFDSVRVKVSVTDQRNVETVVLNTKVKKLLPADTIRLSFQMPTATLPGMNILSVNFNPDHDQPEQHTFNNFAVRNLYVRPDSLNPLLDVTFNGTHILNGDIVSSKPDILIKLKDEAKWMVLNDQNLVTIKLKYPDNITRTLTVGGDTLSFASAGQAPNADNTASFNLKPWLTQDGEYELIVTGRDRSNNSAGNIDYRVRFSVINKPMISNMLNYPNPFTTSTAFVFTLTGSEVPQNIRIQILTITGKVVKEITKAELGPLHIGRNITEYKWDGTDQFGDKLANGVYLYRVITNLNGKSLDKYKSEDDNTDKYFNKGYGKMVLMR